MLREDDFEHWCSRCGFWLRAGEEGGSRKEVEGEGSLWGGWDLLNAAPGQEGSGATPRGLGNSQCSIVPEFFQLFELVYLKTK